MTQISIQKESKSFALEVIKLYKYLVDVNNEFVLSKQMLRSGTSIGANVRESKNAQSRNDFLNKINIALKEADETQYWLELLHESGYLPDDMYNNIYNQCSRLVGTLVNIIKTIKNNIDVAK